MVDAALTGDGFDRMAELAAEEVGRPVAIVVPELDVAVVWPGGARRRSCDALEQLRRGARRRAAGVDPAGSRAGRPDHLRRAGWSAAVGMLARRRAPRRPRRASSCTSRRPPARRRSRSRRRASARRSQPRGGLFERPRGRHARARGGRASRSGRGLRPGRRPGRRPSTDVRSSRPREALALVADECPERSPSWSASGSTRSCLPRRDASRAPVERLAERLRAYGPTGISSLLRATPRELPRAVRGGRA